MIAVQLPGADDADQLVTALLVAGGAIAPPTDPAERQQYLTLAHAVGNGLDLLPATRTAAARP